MSDGSERRWRLALGRYADRHLSGPSGLGKGDQRLDLALDYLYGREYEKRGIHRPRTQGSLDPTQMTALTWLGEARELFPKSVFEVIQGHALDKYRITELLNDKSTLENVEPNTDLLKTLLSFQGRANPGVKEKLREIAKQVITEISETLRAEVRRAFSGRRNPFQRSRLPSAANFDWRNTLRRNLKSYNPETGKIIAEDLRFYSRMRRKLPWTVVLCVDQSGSMTDSIIHSAVMAAIFSGLPGISVSMVLFDTSVIDVSDRLTDPLETLLSVRLGGGTNIGKAVEYCEKRIVTPERTIFVLLTDFAEGASPTRLYRAIGRMAETRVKLIGLTALDTQGDPCIDRMIAGRVAALGMQVGAMTPDKLARWLAGIVR